MTNTFKAGDKVRCINPGHQRGLVKDAEYTVATVSSGPYALLTTTEGYQGRLDRFELAARPPAFKAGDKVRVVRKVTARTSDFQNCWISNMDRVVGNGRTYEIGRVVASGVYFKGETGDAGCGFPPASLELVVEQTSPATIDLKTLQPGDKVTLTVTFTVDSAVDSDGDVELASNPYGVSYLYASDAPHRGTVERAPRPLAVDDKVTTLNGTRGTIKAIVGDRAWIEMVNGGQSVRELTNLKRAA